MVESYPINRRSRWLAILCTTFISVLVISILLLILLHTPIPPYPEGGGGTGNGIELNLGFSNASAANNPQDLSPPVNENVKPEPENNKIITQDVEDAPSLNDKEVKTKKTKKSIPKETTITPKIKNTEPVKPKQVVNPKAMMKSVKNQNGTDINSSVQGNNGDPNGTLGAKAFGGQNGKGGTGGGTGGGQGSGNGSGTGPTASKNLQERNPVLPIPVYNQQVEGVVVVSVTVNSEGVVIDAIPGVKGSTTLEPSLLDAAQQAALKAHFDQKQGSLREKGTIRYHFRLQ